MKLKFLGTGGGRYVTGMQRRRTGGILVKTDETQIHVDPGPGALVGVHEQDDPEETEAVIVSHGHIDHAGDLNAVAEMMTEAYDKPGAVFANESVLEGHGDVDRVLTNHHRDLLGRVEKLTEGEEYSFRDVDIRSQQMFHTDPKTQGFVLETEEKSVGFWTDSEYSNELVDFYQDCDMLVVYCGRPRNDEVPGHTSLDRVPDLAESQMQERLSSLISATSSLTQTWRSRRNGWRNNWRQKLFSLKTVWRFRATGAWATSSRSIII